MKIGLFISTLTCGGAERVMSLLANEWLKRGCEVVLVTLDSNPSFFRLDEGVKHIALGCEKPSKNFVQAVFNLWFTKKELRTVMKRENIDCALAFTTRVNIKVLSAAKGLKIPVVVSERTVPQSYQDDARWVKLRNRWYRKAQAVVVQTPAVEEYYKALGLNNLVIVPNPVEDPLVTVDWNRRKNVQGDFVFLSVARLNKEKGIDLLLKAFSNMKQNARLHILGDGEEKHSLQLMAQDLNIADKVEFLGFINNKKEHWQHSDAFVMTSRYEGFPNALCEAMAAGLPCISFDCPTGPRAIIKTENNGLLVPSEDYRSLALEMDRLVTDSDLRVKLSREGVKILNTLGLESIVNQWEAVFKKFGVKF